MGGKAHVSVSGLYGKIRACGKGEKMIFVVYNYHDEQGEYVCTFAYCVYFSEVVVFPVEDQDGGEQQILSIADDIMEPDFIAPVNEDDFYLDGYSGSRDFDKHNCDSGFQGIIKK